MAPGRETARGACWLLDRPETRRRLAMMRGGLIRRGHLEQRRFLTRLGPERDVVWQADATQLSRGAVDLGLVLVAVLAQHEPGIDDGRRETSRYEHFGNA